MSSPERPKPAGLLDGIRVLDFTRVLAGPYCTAQMADLGAEIIKVEPPQGDDYRHIGPFLDGESALFQINNRGKRSIVIDLKQDDGRALIHDLVRHCDVVIENFTPGVAARLGIDAATLTGIRPDLIYASVSGFGQSGPETDRPAYDLIAQALSGWMSVTGEADGPPFKVGDSLGDLAAGMFAGWGVALALFNRARTGRGMVIDVAMFDSLISLLPTPFSQSLCGITPQRVGNRHPMSTPFGTFAAGDGHFVLCVLNQPQFARLAEIIGRPDFAQDPRFGSDAARTQHEPVLRAAIESWSKARPVEVVTGALQAAKIPTAAIWSVEQALTSQQTAARGLVTETDHPKLGRIRLPQQPVQFSGEARNGSGPAPALGADTDAVLAEILGLSPERIAALASSHAIQQNPGRMGEKQ